MEVAVLLHRALTVVQLVAKLGWKVYEEFILLPHITVLLFILPHFHKWYHFLLRYKKKTTYLCPDVDSVVFLTSLSHPQRYNEFWIL